MAGRDEIIAFCDELLEVAAFDDYGPNGLQVPGRRRGRPRSPPGSRRTASCLERAREAGAQLALAHHGLFWDFAPAALSASRWRQRLRVALGGGLSVAAYHLPLDAHREIGNNALLCAAARASSSTASRSPGARAGDRRRSAARAEPIAADELVAAVAELLGREPLVFDAGPGRGRARSGSSPAPAPRTIGGGRRAAASTPSSPASPPSTRWPTRARAASTSSPPATTRPRRFGVRRLGELVAERFGVEHEFIDVPNPV